MTATAHLCTGVIQDGADFYKDDTGLIASYPDLVKGDYDWAHLAYSIWPDRVREKSKSDKSLAIAHDLEDLYVEG